MNEPDSALGARQSVDSKIKRLNPWGTPRPASDGHLKAGHPGTTGTESQEGTPGSVLSPS